MYHKVYPFSHTMWWVKVNDFYRQMWELQSKEVVFLDDYNPSNPNHVVITFDGIYKNVLEFAAPIMKMFNYPFELFITSDYLSANNAFDSVEPLADFTSIEELQELEKFGGRIQWHTRSHPDLKKEGDAEKIRTELTVPSELYQYFSNRSFKWFAYPYGNFNEEAVKIAKELFTGAVSCNQGNDADKHVYNRLTVTNETSLKPATVACIIASYNYGNFLVEAIESVLKQTILPDEILITDDCSFDSTQEVAEYYVERYPQLISYNRNETNLGIVENFNKAVGLTTSDYIVFLGADNRFLSNYIEECANMLNCNPHVAVAYTDYHFFGERAKYLYDGIREDFKGGQILNTYFHVKFPEYNEAAKTLMEELNFIHGSSMYKRKAYNDAGGYLNKTGIPEDYDLFGRMLKKGYLAMKATNTTLEYRQHSKDQANNKVISQSTVLHYINRAKRLQGKIDELNKILASEELKTFRKYMRVKKRVYSVWKRLKKKIKQ